MYVISKDKEGKHWTGFYDIYGEFQVYDCHPPDEKGRKRAEAEVRKLNGTRIDEADPPGTVDAMSQRIELLSRMLSEKEQQCYRLADELQAYFVETGLMHGDLHALLRGLQRLEGRSMLNAGDVTSESCQYAAPRPGEHWWVRIQGRLEVVQCVMKGKLGLLRYGHEFPFFANSSEVECYGHESPFFSSEVEWIERVRHPEEDHS